ncbi:ABC transporter permease [Sinanaerobacter chloroacetimidivorans]|jgi:tungstate transport system permease protein|uniref:ABC transporter permease n=1 Tax=Sinanaerobacter chloroacetimidivorans TaxID=2818044 RepID=A0A8J8B0S3_9FIRM|nr:ABC transporter permease [Sinanaerobacter chloroacetimidivorans]MBR0597923.1 ABC transporter permease [Sinanaerobacter chloroacetimidivorans]
MEEITKGFQAAIGLLLTGDQQLYEIVGLSLAVSFSAVIISAFLGVPLGAVIGLHDFPFKNALLRIIYTLMSLPPVIAGLVVFLLIMRKGPLGSWGLTYTPAAMIIAQVCLVTPIITGLTYNIVREKAPLVKNIAVTLGAGKIERLKLLILELKIGIMAAIVTGLGRAISEVGAVMIVGGNIKGKTRVMTTYIAQLKSMGDYSTAIAVGIVLLILAFMINAFLYNFQQRDAR